MTGPRDPYRPIGDNPDPSDHATAPDGTMPLVHADDDDPAHDDSAAPDD